IDRVLLPDGRVARDLARIGRGSAATVYRATLEGAHGVARPVALKVFDVTSGDDAQRVRAGAAAIAARPPWVAPPNVVRLTDLAFVGARPAFVFELVRGPSLEAIAERFASREQRLPLDVALFVATEIAEGLEAARAAPGPGGVRLALHHLDL